MSKQIQPKSCGKAIVVALIVSICVGSVILLSRDISSKFTVNFVTTPVITFHSNTPTSGIWSNSHTPTTTKQLLDLHHWGTHTPTIYDWQRFKATDPMKASSSVTDPIKASSSVTDPVKASYSVTDPVKVLAIPGTAWSHTPTVGYTHNPTYRSDFTHTPTQHLWSHSPTSHEWSHSPTAWTHTPTTVPTICSRPSYVPTSLSQTKRPQSHHPTYGDDDGEGRRLKKKVDTALPPKFMKAQTQSTTFLSYNPTTKTTWSNTPTFKITYIPTRRPSYKPSQTAEPTC